MTFERRGRFWKKWHLIRFQTVQECKLIVSMHVNVNTLHTRARKQPVIGVQLKKHKHTTEQHEQTEKQTRHLQSDGTRKEKEGVSSFCSDTRVKRERRQI